MRSFLNFSALLVAILLSNMNLKAQSKIKEHVWAAPEKLNPYPDTLLDKDAFIATQSHEIKVNFDQSAGAIYTTEMIKVRMKVNSQEGLEKNTIIAFSKSKSSRIVKLDARTIKPDGRIVDMITADIKQINIRDDEQDVRLEHLRFSIPGTEVGDEIEYLYTLEYNGINPGRDIHLYNNLPTIQSTFSYVTPTSFYTDFRMYNDMPDPVITKTINDEKFSWTLNNLAGMGEQFASNYTETLPFIRYAVRQVAINGQVISGTAKMGILRNNWSDFYDFYVNVYKTARLDNTYKGTSFEGYMNSWREQHPNYTTDQKMLWLTKFINDTLTIVDLNEEESNNSLIYFLQTKRIDRKNLHNFIRKFMQDNKMNYYIAFARHRLSGTMDVNFASISMIDEVFYTVINEAGEFHFIYPSFEGEHYYLDELPYTLSGADVVLVNRPSDNSLKSDVRKIKIPLLTYDVNARNNTIVLHCDLAGKKMDGKIKESLGGDFSTRYRSSTIELVKSKEYKTKFSSIGNTFKNMMVDSVYIEKQSEIFPYTFNSAAVVRFEENISNIGKNTYAISMAGILNHYYLKTTEEQRLLSYYAPFRYKDNIKVYLQFDEPVEILSNELDKFWMMEELGNYLITVSPVNDKVVLIESKLDLRTAKLNPTEYVTLNKLNGLLEQAMQAQILIKTKGVK